MISYVGTNAEVEILDTFFYQGPNRRSDFSVVEQELRLNINEIRTVTECDIALWYGFASGLHPALESHHSAVETVSGRQDTQIKLAEFCASTCVLLQRAARHLVLQHGVVFSSDSRICHYWFEYEEPDTADQVQALVLDIVALLLTSKQEYNAEKLEASALLKSAVSNFLATASGRAMPADSWALYRAALSRKIPVARMDRPPFSPIKGNFRVRYNALLRLGYGCNQHTLDGTFCVSRSETLFPLIQNRGILFNTLANLNFPLPAANDWCDSPARAARHADRMGYPVSLRSNLRGRTGHRLLPSRDSVIEAAKALLTNNGRVLIQAYVDGPVYRLLLVNGRLMTCLRLNEYADKYKWQVSAEDNPALAELGYKVARAMPTGIVVVEVAGKHSGLATPAYKILDVELAPRLDELFHPEDPLLHVAAMALIEWIYPDPAEARVPVIAITGTNGKTTTCRLSNQILMAAGFTPGMACSDGSFHAGEVLSHYEEGTLLGHLTVLDHPQVDAAVLEATRGGAGSIGLGFDRCDIAICLNVTPDHFNDRLKTDSVEKLAQLKRTIVERASRAAVLNADDEHCCDMIEHLSKRDLGMVSINRKASELFALAPRVVAVATVETFDATPWVTIHRGTHTIPVVRVNDIPISFEGAAKHNVINALHATLATHLLGVPAESIAEGLMQLPATFDALPGRLNFFRELPFDVCLDYAHNPDGVRALSEFTSRLKVDGRRILCLSCSAVNGDDFIRETAASAAGFFDYYICKNFGNLFHRRSEEGPRLLREGLIAAGVAPEAIICVETTEEDGVDVALKFGKAGDLLVIVGGKRHEQIWKQITAANDARPPTTLDHHSVREGGIE